MLKLYKNLKCVGWLGWLEDNAGRSLAFVTIGGMIVPLLVLLLDKEKLNVWFY